LEKAKSCAERLDKYRAEGANASDNLRNQVLHDFFFAIGAPPFYARQDKIPADIQKLVSSLSDFCQYVKQRHNPNVVNLADRIESALGDTMDNYLEDSQIAFSRVAELPPDHGATEEQVPLAIQEMEPLVSGEDVVPSPRPSYTSKSRVEQEPLIKEPLVPAEDVMPLPGSYHLPNDLTEQESLTEEPLVPLEDVMSPDPTHEDMVSPGPTHEDTISPGPTHEDIMSPGPTHEDMILPGPTHEDMVSPGPTHEDMISPGPTHEDMVSPGPTHEDMISPGPTHEDTISPGPTHEHMMWPPSHSSNDMGVEDSPTNESQVSAMPLYRPYYTSDSDPWEGRTDLW
jgi:hypothetical protein